MGSLYSEILSIFVIKKKNIDLWNINNFVRVAGCLLMRGIGERMPTVVAMMIIAYCYKEGKFTQDFSMEEMIEHCARFTDEINRQTGRTLTPEQAKEQMRQFFPHLKRWKEDNGCSIIDKAVELLGRCNEVTLVSVNADGYPRPVPMAKGHTEGCNEVWVATAADSVKVADFKLNPKAGLSYSCNRDSVSLRGHVEIITDDAVRKAMWQDWYIKHFPGGPEDANYLLLHFTGTEATFWINGEFAHVQL